MQYFLAWLEPLTNWSACPALFSLIWSPRETGKKSIESVTFDQWGHHGAGSFRGLDWLLCTSRLVRLCGLMRLCALMELFTRRIDPKPRVSPAGHSVRALNQFSPRTIWRFWRDGGCRGSQEPPPPQPRLQPPELVATGSKLWSELWPPFDFRICLLMARILNPHLKSSIQRYGGCWKRQNPNSRVWTGRSRNPNERRSWATMSGPQDPK